MMFTIINLVITIVLLALVQKQIVLNVKQDIILELVQMVFLRLVYQKMELKSVTIFCLKEKNIIIYVIIIV